MDGGSACLPPTYLSSGQEQGKSHERGVQHVFLGSISQHILCVLFGKNKPKNPKPNDYEKLSPKKAKQKTSRKHHSTTYRHIRYGIFMFLLHYPRKESIHTLLTFSDVQGLILMLPVGSHWLEMLTLCGDVHAMQWMQCQQFLFLNI